jgi:IS30 family transposase
MTGLVISIGRNIHLRSPSIEAGDVEATLKNWMQGFQDVPSICKTITSDNGLGFAKISELEEENLKIYFAHPFSAWERGSNERPNGLLRRMIPEGTAIQALSEHFYGARYDGAMNCLEKS